MFKYFRTVRMSETDATGALYFTELLKMASEAFEEFLLAKKIDFLGNLPLPIVHAEADFVAPIHVGDELVIDLSITHIGTSSFTLVSIVSLKGKEMGKTSIVHVYVSKETGKAAPLPAILKECFNKFPIEKSFV